jgi:hypothetical protein
MTRDALLFHEMVHAYQNALGVRPLDSHDIIRVALSVNNADLLSAARASLADRDYNGATSEILTILGEDAFHIATGFMYTKDPAVLADVSKAGRFNEQEYRNQQGYPVRTAWNTKNAFR